MRFTMNMDALRTHAQASPREGLLDGRAVAAGVRQQLIEYVQARHLQGLRPPGLAVLQVEGDPASSIYVRHKIKACAQIGIHSQQRLLPAETTQADLFEHIDALNQDPNIDGILLQLPLPAHLDPMSFIQRIDPDKDVDGLHPTNLGHLMAWRSRLESCTPRGVMRLLAAYDVPLAGTKAVVIGRSHLVGRPMAQMLVRADATVTVCHRHTVGLEDIVRHCDLLVSAAGVPGLVSGEWIKQGAVVVDVGTTRDLDGVLRGDVGFERARTRARLISPVPGGVGPMTVATLMENTIRAAAYHTSGQTYDE